MNKNPIAAGACFTVIEHKRMKSSASNETISDPIDCSDWH